MTRESPVQVEVVHPLRFDRSLLLVRLLIAIALGWIGITSGLVVGLLFVVLPVFAVIARSSRAPTETATRMWAPLVWLLQLSAFMSLLVDRFPSERDHPVRVAIRFTGAPTTGSALARLLTSLPSAFVLSLLWCVSGLLCVVAVLAILIDRRVPGWYLAFGRGVLRWNARLVAYHASLVEDYPPFELDTDDLPAVAASASR